jgi:hypothetical protein
MANKKMFVDSNGVILGGNATFDMNNATPDGTPIDIYGPDGFMYTRKMDQNKIKWGPR